jgi:branched-chain amino acid transport system substrate-binding protein
MQLIYKQLAVAMAACVALCTNALAYPTGITATEIIIGQTIDAGPNASEHAAAVNAGIKLYLDKTNANGGVHGRSIVLRVLDDGTQAKVAEANAVKLVDDGAFLLFGTLEGGPSAAVAKIALERGVVLFAPMAGSPVLRQPYNPMVFPVRASHKTEFGKLLTHSATTGLHTVAFLHANTDIGRAHLQNVKYEAGRAGVDLVAQLVYTEDMTDAQLDGLVAIAKQSGAQTVMNHGSPKIWKRFIARSKNANFTPRFLGVNSGSSEIAKQLGAAGAGLVFSQVTPNPNSYKQPVVTEYRQAWKLAYPNKPLSHGGLEGYLSAKALVLALSEAGRQLTVKSFIEALYRKPLSLGGLEVDFSPGDHRGMRFVDTSTVRSDGTFLY